MTVFYYFLFKVAINSTFNSILEINNTTTTTTTI